MPHSPGRTGEGTSGWPTEGRQGLPWTDQAVEGDHAAWAIDRTLNPLHRWTSTKRISPDMYYVRVNTFKTERQTRLI